MVREHVHSLIVSVSTPLAMSSGKRRTPRTQRFTPTASKCATSSRRAPTRGAGDLLAPTRRPEDQSERGHDVDDL